MCVCVEQTNTDERTNERTYGAGERKRLHMFEWAAADDDDDDDDDGDDDDDVLKHNSYECKCLCEFDERECFRRSNVIM